MKQFLVSLNQEEIFEIQSKIPVMKKTKGGIKVSKQFASAKLDHALAMIYNNILKSNEKDNFKENERRNDYENLKKKLHEKSLTDSQRNYILIC